MLQGLNAFMNGLGSYISTRQIGLQAKEIAAADFAPGQAAAALQPVIDNDLVKITPVLLAAANQVPRTADTLCIRP